MTNQNTVDTLERQLESAVQEIETLKTYCMMQESLISDLTTKINNQKHDHHIEIEKVLHESEKVIRTLESEVSRLSAENSHLEHNNEKNLRNIKNLIAEKSRL